eukprot:GHRQ01035282.1.p1 GENE.GHRQ01035282.1~~GHRQ01035282.1.p1  ORF type:complete len:246 (+),score=86.93 GHRQ01035282.1:437-1174(+)
MLCSCARWQLCPCAQLQPLHSQHAAAARCVLHPAAASCWPNTSVCRLQVLSLAQGVVHWRPPPAATAAAAALLASEAGQAGSGVCSATDGMAAVFGAGGVHSYGPALGLPPLVEALKQKLAARNGLAGYEVMVTAGANQGFVNAVLALCDASDRVVLFVPYYFNHIMALQMTGGTPQVVLGPCCAGNLHPDWGWLQQQLAGPQPPKMVVLVNPCNPTGGRSCAGHALHLLFGLSVCWASWVAWVD